MNFVLDYCVVQLSGTTAGPLNPALGDCDPPPDTTTNPVCLIQNTGAATTLDAWSICDEGGAADFVGLVNAQGQTISTATDFTGADDNIEVTCNADGTANVDVFFDGAAVAATTQTDVVNIVCQ